MRCTFSLEEEINRYFNIIESFSKNTLKVDPSISSRICSFEDTLSKALKVKDKVGISRVANITGMDRLQIPNFSAYIPDGQENQITVFGGKGMSVEEAKVGSILEAVERASAIQDDSRITFSKYSPQKDQIKMIKPEDLIIYENVYNAKASIPWVVGYDLLNNQPVYLPAFAAFHFCLCGPPLYLDTSIGLSSGNNYLESILYGVLEVVERDSISIAVVNGNAPKVKLSTLPKELNEIVSKITSNNIYIELRYIPNDYNIPTFFTAGIDLDFPSTSLINRGVASHPNPIIAARQSILEMVHSRGVIITGAREDLERRNYYRSPKEAVESLGQTFRHQEISFADIVTGFYFDNLIDEFNEAKKRISQAGFKSIILYDLSNPEFLFPVVRMVIPSMENYFEDRERIGTRLLRAFEGR